LMNANNTPSVASPKRNIAGIQTNKFIAALQTEIVHQRAPLALWFERNLRLLQY
jgi:hypothetical protein